MTIDVVVFNRRIIVKYQTKCELETKIVKLVSSLSAGQTKR